MAQLTWDATGQRYYEVGVDRGVLFVDNTGVAWSGLVSIDESPSGGEARPFYLDGEKYLNLASREEFEATINAFYSPEEFDACDGVLSAAPGLFAHQQRRKTFGLSYRTRIANDLVGHEYGYKIHIVYNALVSPSQRNRSTINDNAEVPVLSWPITTKPAVVPGMMRTSHFVIDSTEAGPIALKTLEDILYGTAETAPSLPSVAELITLLTVSEEFEVTDLGDGSFIISGSNDQVSALGNGLYEITHDAVIPVDEDSFQISSP